MSLRNLIVLLAAFLLSIHTPVSAAEPVALFLKINGTDVQGEPTATSLGRENSIECMQWEMAVSTAREAGSGMATGRRQYAPLKIVKRIDRSTPLLAKALTENQVVEGTFKFFRPNPAGDGTTQQFYTVAIAQGRIASIKQVVPDTTNPATQSLAPMEEVTFVFSTISWTYTNGGITHQDSVSEGR